MNAPRMHPRTDRAAERDILGAILIDDSALAIAEAYITPASFSEPRYAVVYEAMRSLVQRRAGVDVVTLAAELRKSDRLQSIGGPQAIGELTDEVGAWAVTAAHIEERARIVADLAQCRAIATASALVSERALDPRQSAADLREFATRKLSEASGPSGGKAVVHHKVGFDVVSERCRRGRTPSPVGLSTGFPAVDRIIKGLAPGRVYVVAGRPAMGKSAWAEQVANHVAAKQAKPVLFFSLEMPRQEVFDRGVAQAAMVPVDRVENPSTADDAERDEVEWTAQEYAKIPMLIRDATPLKVADLVADARLTKMRYPDLGLIVVDYLQLVRPDRPSDNREREVAEVCEALKALAKELSVPVMALAQINRGVEARADKRPSLGDLRESGAIEQIADVVAFLYRDEYYHPDSAEKGIAEVIIAKGRGCATGTARLGFVSFCAAFTNTGDA